MSLHKLPISVIVPTFSQHDKLSRLLSSLDHLEIPPLEVIVIDDFSNDNTPHLLKKWSDDKHRFDAKYIRLEKNLGPVAARNTGIRAAVGSVIAFTDSDCRVDSHWLEELTNDLDKSKGVVGVGGKVLPMKRDLISLYSSFHRVLEPPRSLLYLVTANCCYFRDEVITVGGFDESIRKPGGEDIGLSIKLIKKKWRFVYSPSAIVFHEFRNNVFDFYRTYRQYGEGCALVAKNLKD